MNNTNTGGPAFPTGTGVTPYNPGMTLRDYFAAKAMQSLITVQFQTKQAQSAETAYEWADAMLKARKA
jgi:ketol-acid reductoisomerase